MTPLRTVDVPGLAAGQSQEYVTMTAEQPDSPGHRRSPQPGGALDLPRPDGQCGSRMVRAVPGQDGITRPPPAGWSAPAPTTSGR